MVESKKSTQKTLGEVSSHSLFELAQTPPIHPRLLRYLESSQMPWELLGERLKAFFELLPGTSDKLIPRQELESRFKNVFFENLDSIYVEEGAILEQGAFLSGPCFVEAGAVVRHGAYLRGLVYLSHGAVAGHTTEVKGSLFLPGAKASHFAYVGDSLLGINCNLGAGTKLANLRFDHGFVQIRIEGKKFNTELKKLGSILGNRSQTGCNSVCNPGTILLPGACLGPNQTGLGVLDR